MSCATVEPPVTGYKKTRPALLSSELLVSISPVNRARAQHAQTGNNHEICSGFTGERRCDRLRNRPTYPFIQVFSVPNPGIVWLLEWTKAHFLSPGIDDFCETDHESCVQFVGVCVAGTDPRAAWRRSSAAVDPG